MTLQGIWGIGTGQLPLEATGSIEVSADAHSPSGWTLRATNASTFAQLTPLGNSSASPRACVLGGWFYIPTGVNTRACIALSTQTGWDSLRLDTDVAGVFKFGVHWNDGSPPAPDFGNAAEIRDEWFHMAIHWRPNNTTGVFTLRINGADVGLDVASGDTYNSGDDGTTVRFLRWRGIGVKCHSLYFADVDGAAPYNDILTGTPYVDSQTVTGSGTSDWTGSDADSIDNHLLVDEAPTAAANTTDYIESSTVGHRQLFDPAAVGITGDVHAVKVTGWGRDTEAGGQQVDIGVLSNATESTTPKSLPSSDGEISNFFAQDPDGPAAWDTAARNALDVVLEVA